MDKEKVVEEWIESHKVDYEPRDLNYEIPESVKIRMSSFISDDEIFKCFNELLKAKREVLVMNIMQALKGTDSNEELVGVMRYYKGKLDAFDEVHFYLVKWRSDFNRESKKEEEKKEEESEKKPT